MALKPVAAQAPPAKALRTGRVRKRPDNLRLPVRATHLWYALSFPAPLPDLSVIASTCTQVTDYISLVPPDAVLLEVRGSLRYFGGLQNIRKQLQQILKHHPYQEAVSPSPVASLLLARHGVPCAVAHPAQLRAVLGALPVNSLPLDKNTLRALQRCGLSRLQDLWRLPAAQLRLRFGRPLHDYLARLKGEQPWSPARWQAPATFAVQQEFEYPLSSTVEIQNALTPLLEQLEQFLRQRHLQTDRLYLALRDESGQSATQQPLLIGTRLPTQQAQVFALLIETRLSQTHLKSTVQSLRLRVERYQPFVPAGGVRNAPRVAATTRYALVDMLAARLGAHQVCQFNLRPLYAPELASQLIGYRTTQQTSKKSSEEAMFPPLPGGPDNTLAPVWLLNPPRRLSFRDQRLYYHSYLHLVRGPHRIETLWWSPQRLRRDYYVAHNEQGIRLWIYHDLGKADAPEYQRWYLHGLFG